MMQYTVLLESRSNLDPKKSYLHTGDDFYLTLDDALSEAVYQTTGPGTRGTHAVCIMSVDAKTGETHTVVMREDMGEAMRDYIRSQMSTDELEAEDHDNAVCEAYNFRHEATL